MLDSDSGSGISIPHPRPSEQNSPANFSMPPVVVPSLSSATLPPNLSARQAAPSPSLSVDSTAAPLSASQSATSDLSTSPTAANSAAPVATAADSTSSALNATAPLLGSFEAAAPASPTMPPINPSKPASAAAETTPRPAIELSNPMAPRALFETEAPSTTPSVAFNDPANSPDAPRPGVDPNGKQQGMAQAKLRQLEHSVSPHFKTLSETIKANPMRALLVISSSVIVILIIAIAIVS